MVLIIRNVRNEDLPSLITIENLCFSSEEAATKEAFKNRIQLISDSFFVALHGEEIVGLINGPVIKTTFISDDLFNNIKINPIVGGHQSILGLAVAPHFRKKGVASALLAYLENDAAKKKRKTITLTCKSNLIPFYENFGFKNHGISNSEHGGVIWYNMSKEIR